MRRGLTGAEVRWVVIVLALTTGGWLFHDGLHALRTGDYVTPGSGPRAGRLGPWSKVVEAVGIEPRSALMHWIHVVLGGVWLGVTAAFAAGRRWARRGMLLCAVAALWYLPFGTLLGLIQIGLLTLVPQRGP